MSQFRDLVYVLETGRRELIVERAARKKGGAKSRNRGVFLIGLRSTRQRQGLAQRELANRAGTGQGTV